MQEQIYDENDRMEKEAEKIARWVGRKWKRYKKRRKLELAGKIASMGHVVLDAVAAHEAETVGERTFLIQKEKKEPTGDTGFLGFFQSLGTR